MIRAIFKESVFVLSLSLLALSPATAASLALKSARFNDGVLTVVGTYRGARLPDDGLAQLFDKRLDTRLASISLLDIPVQKGKRRFIFSLTALRDVPCAVRVSAEGVRDKKLKVRGIPRKACSLGIGTEPPATALAGSVWYQADSELLRINAGTGERLSVARRRNIDGVLAPFPAGQRYMETHNRNGTANVQVSDVGSQDRAVGSYSLKGYGLLYRGSWDGRYVSFTWSPAYSDTIGDQPRIDLAIVDFKTPAKPVLIRKANVQDNVGPTAIISHAWLPDGRYVYLRANLQIVVGNPSTGEAGEQTVGTLDTQGQLFSGWDVSPDGASLLVSLRDPNGRLANNGGDHDIFLTTLGGQMLGRLTSSDYSEQPHWSPDGRSFLFKQNPGYVCQGSGCIGECNVEYAGTDQRGVVEGTNLRPGNEIIPCQSADVYWTP